MHRGDVLDIALLVLAALYALRGFRRGLLYSVLTTAGFLAGAAVGSRVAPYAVREVLKHQKDTSAASHAVVQRVVTVLIVVFAAFIGEALIGFLARRVRTAVRLTPLGVADGAGGAALGAVGVLLVAWLLGTALGSAPYPNVVKQIHRSEVLAIVNRAVPDTLRNHFAELLRSLQEHDFPAVFDPLENIPGITQVAAPDAGVVPGALRASGSSVVKIVGQAPECSRQSEGSGFVIGTDRIMTNAHVVAGVRALTVTTPGPGSRTFVARVVLYDPQRDVAVLLVPGLDRKVLAFAGPAKRGDSAVVVGYPEDGPFKAVPARISSDQLITGPNIYQSSTVTRQVYTLRTDVEPGNSGGPLLAPDGKVDGVVFARSTDQADVGYALTATEVASDYRTGLAATSAVSTQSCD